eukprot:2224847-Pyramimonas_sp.AAC.1
MVLALDCTLEPAGARSLCDSASDESGPAEHARPEPISDPISHGDSPPPPAEVRAQGDPEDGPPACANRANAPLTAVIYPAATLIARATYRRRPPPDYGDIAAQ